MTLIEYALPIRSPRIAPLLISAWLLYSATLAVGQVPVSSVITPDGTLGTTVTQSGTTYAIGGGTISGSNLFHSFDLFSVGTGDTATFTGPTGIANILSRVTGGQPSLIDGRLRSEILGASLFLLNPSGVLFGPHASLDVSGSFHVSTADFLRFADGATFSAKLGHESVLTIASPTAFGFLGNDPTAITIQGSSLQVPDGKALSVVGGDLRIEGGILSAPSGQIQLASVASPGEVVFYPLELSPDLQVDSFMQLGRLEFLQGTILDASGDGGGTVLLRGSQLLVDQSSMRVDNTGSLDGSGLGLDLRITGDAVLAHGATLTADSRGAGRARDIRVSAANLSVDDALVRSRAFASGDGGNVAVHVGSLSLTNGGRVDTSSVGGGRGGQLSVTATEAVTIVGHDSEDLASGLFSFTRGSGDAGHIVIATPTLTMDEGFIAATTVGAGHAGDIVIQVGRLTLSGGAIIDSSTLEGSSGTGGTVTITATDSVVISGHGSTGIESGVSSFAGRGDGGRVVVSTPTLSLDGGTIQTSTEGLGRAGDIVIQAGQLTLTGGAIINSGTLSAGRAGDIVIQAGQLTLTAGAFIDSGTGTSSTGQGGAITITATDSIIISGTSSEGLPSGLLSFIRGRGDGGPVKIVTPTLHIDGGFITTQTFGAGRAGDIDIQAGRLILTGGAVIDSGTVGGGGGGTLTITASDSITISGTSSNGLKSTISSAAGSSGDAGQVLIITPTLNMDAGAITASSLGTGNAGNIDIQVGQLLLTGGATINSFTGGAGAAGTVTITATDSVIISGQGGDLPSGLNSFTSGSVNAGQIFIVTPNLSMDGGTISTASGFGAGHAGNIVIQVGQLTLTGGAAIDSSTGGTGHAGTITITATDSIVISGTDANGFNSHISSFTLGHGDAGRVLISAPSLRIDGGFILTATGSEGRAGDIDVDVGRLAMTGGAFIDSSTHAAGQGGTVNVTTSDVVSLSGQNTGLFTGATGSGAGGDITLQARQIELSDGAVISASSTGGGAAGTIQIQAAETFQSERSSVATASTSAGGGAIALRAGRLVRLSDSELTTTVQGGGGDAGNLTLEAPLIVAQNSDIIANAFAGQGGNIRIDAEVFLADPAAQVSASSELGVQGTVAIQAPVTELSGSVAPLPQTFVSAAELLPARCAARLAGGTTSSLVLGGRGGMPPSPGGVLPSPLAMGTGTPAAVEPQRGNGKRAPGAILVSKLPDCGSEVTMPPSPRVSIRPKKAPSDETEITVQSSP